MDFEHVLHRIEESGLEAVRIRRHANSIAIFFVDGLVLNVGRKSVMMGCDCWLRWPVVRSVESSLGVEMDLACQVEMEENLTEFLSEDFEETLSLLKRMICYI